LVIFKCWTDFLDQFVSFLKSKELGLGREERKKRRKRRKRRAIKEIIVDFSSGVIPIKVCESLVWVYPFPPTYQARFYDLRRDWICC